jgi:hypothetical protein
MLLAMRISSAALLALALLACRPDGKTIETVSDDPVIQAKLETARSVLADILVYKQKGKNVYPDCKTAEMLFYKDLRRLREAPAAKKLLDDLQEACRNVQP